MSFMKERISEIPVVAALEARTEAQTLLPDLTDTELRKLAREKLSHALQAVSPTQQPELTRKLCAELMDRLDGKPAQAITMDATMRQITVNATIRFADQHMVIDNDTIPSKAIEAIDNKG